MTLLIAATLTWYVCSGVLPWEFLGDGVNGSVARFSTRRVCRGRQAGVVLGFGTLFATLASANGCINDASRAWFAMGRDRYLPGWFGAVHPKYRTPYRSIIFLVPIALIFALVPAGSGDHLRSCRGFWNTRSCR
jgi:ethanolamine permease